MSVYKEVQFIGSDFPLVFAGGFAQSPAGGNAFAIPQRNVIVTVVGTGTVVIHGSAQALPPDFSATSTISNSHAVIVVADYSLATNQYVTSIIVAGATKICELNTNFLTWMGIQVTAGSPEVIVTITDNA